MDGDGSDRSFLGHGAEVMQRLYRVFCRDSKNGGATDCCTQLTIFREGFRHYMDQKRSFKR